MDIDGAPDIAVEAGVEETGSPSSWILLSISAEADSAGTGFFMTCNLGTWQPDSFHRGSRSGISATA